VSICSDDDTNSTKESDGEYDSEHDSGVDMRIEDDVEAPDGVDLDCDVDMERDGDDEEEEDEQEEDEEEEQVEDEDEDEDDDENDDKERRTIGQRETVNTWADDVDTMVDDQPTVQPGRDQMLCEHTPRPQPAPRPQTLDPRPGPQTPVTHPLSGLEFKGLWRRWNLAQRRQLCEKLWQPDTHRMWMWISSHSANLQEATVSPMSHSLMSLALCRARMAC